MADFSMFGPEGMPQNQVAELRIRQGQAQLLQAQAKKASIEADQMQKVRDLMRQAAMATGGSVNAAPGVSSPADVAAPLEYGAKLYMQAGDFMTGASLEKSASYVRAQQAEQLNRATRTVEVQQRIEQNARNRIVSLLGMAKDDSSLDTANRMYQAEFGQPSPFTGQPYAAVKDQIEALQKSTLSGKEQIAAQANAAKEKFYEKNVESQIAHRNFQEELASIRAGFKSRQDVRLGKIGGKAIGNPQKLEIEAARVLVHNAMPGLPLDDEDDKAYAVAAKARALRMANPAIDAHESMVQAMKGLSGSHGMTYQDGSNALSALPLPADGKFEVGKFYQGPAGVGRFTGSGFDMGGSPEEEPEEE